MLSANELIECREKPVPDIPSFGIKSFEPDGSAEESCSIQESISEIKNIISYERVKMIGSLSQAIWRPELNLAEVTQKNGPHWSVMGHTIDHKLFLYPEEALYLLETGALEIIYNEISLSVQRAYFVLLKEPSDITLEKYRVYSQLNALGYKVLRHSPENTVTKYEKQIEVHKLGIKLKKPDGFKSEKRPKKSEKELGSCKKLKLDLKINFPVDYTEDCDIKRVLRKMQIFQPSSDKPESNLNFDFDIYVESKKQVFKKSCLQLPNYRIIIHRSDVPMLDLNELTSFTHKFQDEVPVIHAVVFPDYIAFYEINPVILPEPYDF